MFDGHGGDEISQYVAENLPEVLKSNKFFKKRQYEDALRDSFR